MTKDVIVTISGIQMLDGGSEDVEVITTGNYYYKNGKHYVLYEEILEGYDGPIKSTIKIKPGGSMDIIRSGLTNMHMSFEQDKKSLTTYSTPIGEMMMGIYTRNIEIMEAADAIKIEVDYALDINYQHVAVNNMVIGIQSRSNARMNLRS